MRCADCGVIIRTKDTVYIRQWPFYQTEGSGEIGPKVPVCRDRSGCRIRVQHHRLQTFIMACAHQTPA